MKNRFPRIQDVVPVYAVISCMIYGWTLVLFFWKLPSWLHFMTLSQVFGAFSYGILTNLLESLIAIGGLLSLCALLPSRYLRDSFVDRGSTITIIALGSVMLYQYQFRAVRFDFANDIRLWFIVTVFAILLFVFLVAKIGFLKSAIMNISDRLIIFLYIFVPLSVICVLDVIIRNLS